MGFDATVRAALRGALVDAFADEPKPVVYAYPKAGLDLDQLEPLLKSPDDPDLVNAWVIEFRGLEPKPALKNFQLGAICSYSITHWLTHADSPDRYDEFIQQLLAAAAAISEVEIERAVRSGISWGEVEIEILNSGLCLRCVGRLTVESTYKFLRG